MPILDALDLAQAAISDCLAQSVQTRLLLINQGSSTETRQTLERIAEQNEERVFLWSFDPALPSLSGVWNRGLDFCWATGGEEVLVVNSDVRLSPLTVGILKMNLARSNALFISAVGVTPDQFQQWIAKGDELFSTETTSGVPQNEKGGPDFSCFMISAACHQRYPFDENYIPCYGEDICYHRELMLGEDGARIFSINLPFAHYASGTLKSMTPAARQKKEAQINSISRAYHARAWGGSANQERFTRKGDPSSARDGVSTPELQRRVQAGATSHAAVCGDEDSAIPSSTALC
jgi:hypothetical protein